MARPEKPIPFEGVQKLASYHCTNVEIAEFYGVDEKTIRNRFSDLITKNKAETRYKLRKAQIQEALEQRNWKMMIWLGKQMLGQKDNQDLTSDGRAIGGFEIKVDNKDTAEKLAKLIS